MVTTICMILTLLGAQKLDPAKIEQCDRIWAGKVRGRVVSIERYAAGGKTGASNAELDWAELCIRIEVTNDSPQALDLAHMPMIWVTFDDNSTNCALPYMRARDPKIKEFFTWEFARPGMVFIPETSTRVITHLMSLDKETHTRSARPNKVEWSWPEKSPGRGRIELKLP